MNAPQPTKRILLIGIGNNGRADDGLGWKFADEYDEATFIDVEHRYQLQVEDAELISQYNLVIFVDASHEQVFKKGYSFRRVRPSQKTTFTTHKLSAEAVLWLALDLYSANPQSYMLAINGKDWDLKQGLSEVATQNLKRALLFFDKWIDNEVAVHA